MRSVLGGADVNPTRDRILRAQFWLPPGEGRGEVVSLSRNADRADVER
jgi:hypothetical protein